MPKLYMVMSDSFRHLRSEWTWVSQFTFLRCSNESKKPQHLISIVSVWIILNQAVASRGHWLPYIPMRKDIWNYTTHEASNKSTEMIEDRKYTSVLFSQGKLLQKSISNEYVHGVVSPVSFKCDNSSCQWCGINSTGPLSHISLSANRQLLAGQNITHLILSHRLMPAT